MGNLNTKRDHKAMISQNKMVTEIFTNILPSKTTQNLIESIQTYLSESISQNNTSEDNAKEIETNPSKEKTLL